MGDYPLEIGGETGGRGEGDNFGRVVGMLGGEGILKRGVGGGRGLDESLDFGLGVGFVFPGVDGGCGKEGDTGGELALDEECANLSRNLFIGEGDEHESCCGAFWGG